VSKLRVSKWRILDGKGESDLMSDSELLDGSPRSPMSIKDHFMLGPVEQALIMY
jgi:hypothetical protein